MTDEPHGDVELKRWLAQQDPFGNTDLERQIHHAKVEQQRAASSLVSFGVVLPYVVMMVGILGFACFAGWALQVLP